MARLASLLSRTASEPLWRWVTSIGSVFHEPGIEYKPEKVLKQRRFLAPPSPRMQQPGPMSAKAEPQCSNCMTATRPVGHV